MARHVELCEDCKEGSRMKTSDNHGRVPPMFAASQRRYCAGGLSAGVETPPPPPAGWGIFFPLFPAARAAPTHPPPPKDAQRNASNPHTRTRNHARKTP